MPHSHIAICPCCGKQASTNTQTDGIEKYFGWRHTHAAQAIPQANCRACRAAHCTAQENHCRVTEAK